MIIRGWRIEGFGHFYGAEVSGLAPGLTVLEGPNEAGKSTLLGFLRFMLFGFARNQAQKYPPLAGGRHGGVLHLEDARGEWRLERFQGKPPRLTTPDGGVEGDEALRELLGRLDGAIFRDVFAFSLWELSNLEALSQDEVRDRLYSVGLTGAGRSASSARTALTKEIDALLRPKSKEGRLNRLLSELSGVREELRAAQLQAERYSSLAQSEREEEERIDALRREERAMQKRRGEVDLLRRLEATWRRLTQIEAELGREAGQIDGERAQEAAELLVERRDQERRLKELAQQAEDLAAAVERARPPQALLQVAPAVEGLARDLALREESSRRLVGLQREISDRRAERARQAAALRLPEGAPAPLLDDFVRQAIDEWAGRLRAGEEAERGAERELVDAERAQEAARGAVQDLDRLLAPLADTPDAEELERRRATLSSLQRSAERTRALRANLVLLDALGAAMVLLGVLGSLGGFPFLLAAALGGIALLLYAPFGPLREMRSLGRDAKAAARENDIPWPAPEAELERRRREAETGQVAAAQRSELAKHLAEARAQLARREEAVEQSRAALKALQEKRAVAESDFRAFKEGQGLPLELSPARLETFTADIAALAATDRELARREAEAREIEAAQEAWRQSAEEALSQAAAEVPQDEGALFAAVEALGRDVRRALTAQEKVLDLLAERKELLGRRDDLARRASGAAERLAALLSELGAKDGEELALLLDAAQTRSQILEHAGDGAEAVIAQLKEADFEKLAQEDVDLEERLERIGREREEAAGRARVLRHEREQLAQTADVPERAAREQSLLTEVRRAAEEWRKAYAARQLLERTLAIYERDRQPEVLRFASDAFSRITAGRYVSVRQRSDEGRLYAVDASGALRAPDELSRGTAEQLYLALRLGLAASFGERVAALPLVLDDVLVNFDPARARAVLSVLGEFSCAPGRQALLFTCHPYVSEMAHALDGAQSLTLPAPGAAVEAAAARDPLQADGDMALAILGQLSGEALTLKELAQRSGIPLAQVRREVESLEESGRVEAVGERRGRRYRLAAPRGLF